MWLCDRVCESVHVLHQHFPSWNCAQSSGAAPVTDGGQTPCYCVLMVIILADSWRLFKGFEELGGISNAAVTQGWSVTQCWGHPQTDYLQRPMWTSLWFQKPRAALQRKGRNWHWMLSPPTISQTVPRPPVCYPKSQVDNLGEPDEKLHQANSLNQPRACIWPRWGFKATKSQTPNSL